MSGSIRFDAVGKVDWPKVVNWRFRCAHHLRCHSNIRVFVVGRSRRGFGVQPAVPAAQPFKVGTLQLVALHDAQIVLHNDGKIFGAEVGPAAIQRAAEGGGVAG